MNIVPHHFANITISQTSEDIALKDGRIIPKGYVNATEMCKANKKRFDVYRKSKSVSEFINSIKVHTPNGGSKYQPIEISVEGNTGLSGVWVHYKVALHLAIWISPEFGNWAMEVLMHVITGNFQALTKEAEQAQQQLQKIWNELRIATKESFWFLADEIDLYYQSYPREEKYPGQNYAEVFDTLNLGLFGKRAKSIKEELGIGKAKLNRDHFGNESLKRIEMIQRIASANIQYHLKNPVDAVETALALMNYPMISYKK